METNLAKILVEQFNRSKPWIMLKTGCSDQTVENWLSGQIKPARYYAMVLARLVKLEREKEK